MEKFKYNVPLDPEGSKKAEITETEGAAFKGELNNLGDLNLEIIDLGHKIIKLDQEMIVLYEKLEKLHTENEGKNELHSSTRLIRGTELRMKELNKTIISINEEIHKKEELKQNLIDNN